MYALLCQDKNGETKAVMYEERCPSYKESNKGNKQRQGPALGVRFTEVSVKRESTGYLCRCSACTKKPCSTFAGDFQLGDERIWFFVCFG